MAMGLSARIKAAEAQRQDGFTNWAVKEASKFQMWAERQPGCDYNRLREVLKAAQNNSYTAEELKAMYVG